MILIIPIFCLILFHWFEHFISLLEITLLSKCFTLFQLVPNINHKCDNCVSSAYCWNYNNYKHNNWNFQQVSIARRHLVPDNWLGYFCYQKHQFIVTVLSYCEDSDTLYAGTPLYGNFEVILMFHFRLHRDLSDLWSIFSNLKWLSRW